jgi:putative ABC transport system permease protein
LAAMLIATLRERRYEFSVMRTLGASARTIFLLVQMESLCVALSGIVLGTITLIISIIIGEHLVAAQFGIDIGLTRLTWHHAATLLYVVFGAMFVTTLPALISFMRSR